MRICLSLIFFSILSLNVKADPGKLKLEQLNLPDGFKISYFAKDVENARQMALSDNGVIYVGSRGAGKVHALKDTNNDGVADKKWLIAEGLFLPSGLAWKD
ncbi:MAG: sorbosone dehydrogenase family protein, partial [Gammaproteobacteria bacterium]|nr:sorbosone dehydrogenase family protein [Gammaproteobacteria bacterium]